MTTPRNDDVRKAVNSAVEQVRTPLLAVLGAGNLASQAVADAVSKAKDRVTESSESARKNLEELPTDVDSLREKLDPAELRKVIDEYTDAAVKLYNKLAESGEQAWDKIAAQPQVKKALEQLEDALRTAQDRVDDVTTEARGRVDDVLGKVTKRTRSVGEKTANRVTEVAGEVAEKVEEIGDDVAHETRSASRKAANKTAPRAASTTRRSTTSSTTPAAKKPANGSKPAK
ncbi:membrane protein [Amycolatopsis nigrescens]|uniref:membrane protein n=1 Tax=Amycolatopsis nigrescens TaxID=381445 RepID=UPI00037FA782|nr:membrane protein [Amycolatopsis nigrescens]